MKTQSTICLIFIVLILFLFAPVNSTAQLMWEKDDGNPVMEVVPGSWYAWNVFFPVVIFEDNTYKMWFCGNNNSTYRHIGYATSSDGLDWDILAAPVISGGDPGNWAKHIYPGSVLRINDTLRMWFCGSTNSSDDGSIGYAWSLDEYNWNILPDPVLEAGENGDWDDYIVFHPSVWYDASIYHMIFMGADNNTETWQLGYATSPDGRIWEKYEDNPVLTIDPANSFYKDGIIHGTPIMHNGAIHLFFTGCDGTSSFPPYYSYWRIGYAWSTDFINWSIHPEPVLDVGDPGSWDETIVAAASILIQDEHLKMWYWGDHYNANWEIGYADGIISNLFEYNNSKNEAVKVFPNPSENGSITITLDNPHNLQLTCFNTFGTQVHQQEITGTETVINVSTWSQGIYLAVVVEDGKPVETAKFVVQ